MCVPLGLYIHVPFCRRRCHYCHFKVKVFHPGHARRSEFAHAYVEALTRELVFYGKETGLRPLASIYLGGGTPSYLPKDLLEEIFNTIHRYFKLEPNCEVTLELNPEDVGPDTSEDLRAMGVTRASLGVQSFQAGTLQAVRRNHTPEMALTALGHLRRFPHGLSMDLILGLPQQSIQSLKDDLEIWDSFQTEHISLYLLERDLPVPLDKYPGPIPDEDEQADFYEFTRSFLNSRGLEHYEISNFCKPGFASRHNLNYWEFGDYIGAGPAAHGRIGRTYWQNHPNVGAYQQAVQAQGYGIKSKETWSKQRWTKEEKMQRMRLLKGVPDQVLTGKERAEFKQLAAMKMLQFEDGNWRLSSKGLMLANEVFQVFV